MTITQFRQLAAYNRWANARLYAAALDLSDQGYRLHIGVFFGSLAEPTARVRPSAVDEASFDRSFMFRSSNLRRSAAMP